MKEIWNEPNTVKSIFQFNAELSCNDVHVATCPITMAIPTIGSAPSVMSNYILTANIKCMLTKSCNISHISSFKKICVVMPVCNSNRGTKTFDFPVIVHVRHKN